MSNFKSIQIQPKYNDADYGYLLRAAGVKRVFPGWYTVCYNGVAMDKSTVVSAKRNRGGKIKQNTPVKLSHFLLTII